MAVSKTILPGRLGANSSTVTGANAAAVAVATSSSTIYVVEIDNSAVGADSFVKLYNLAAGSTTVGSDDPVVILKAPASKKVTYHFDQGVALGTAITLACLNSAATAGTSMSGTVNVTVVYD